MTKRPYYELPGLENVYLEDSYILEIRESEKQLAFLLDAVLTEQHPNYEPPAPGDRYCLQKGLLQFDEVKEIKWLRKTMHPSIDAEGVVDYDNIDSFFEIDGVYELDGYFGSIRVRSAPPTFTLIGD